ncbi:hypothetical protein HanXRQr2_Chr16g0755051 [Helianthus annuus]|uniref:Uncharacterized protein n=1 Tax=Helianthus annuus TaxID=4232 RepID=A0A9K3GZ76_HELAN|nr:hypothetical protein HanXRQr2_Chr16g0755051 [Helianthus annuus]
MGRFWRMKEAFEVARKVRDCESSGSEHSPETMMDLSHMVNSFIENGNGVVNIDFDMQVDDESSSDGTDDDMEEIKESLRRLIENGDDVKRNLISKVEKANNDVVDDNRSSQSLGFKRRLMACLRDRGLDAEFEIARPTAGYASLLEILPGISVFKVEDFKEMVKIMSKAIKRSMKQKKMPVPPWRRREYVQAKWFGSYKRTTNEYPTKKTPDRIVINNQSIGFISIPDHTCYGRRQDQFARKDFGYKMGNLAMVMNGAS